MSRYTLTLQDGTAKPYARKDAAVKAGDKAGQPFYVTAPSGTIVHDTRPELEPEAAEAADELLATEQAEWDAAAPTEPEAEPLTAVHPVFYVGPKHFWPFLGRSLAETIAEAAGVGTVEIRNQEHTVTLFGADDQAVAAVAALIETSRHEARSALKDFMRTAAYRKLTRSEGYEKEKAFLVDFGKGVAARLLGVRPKRASAGFEAGFEADIEAQLEAIR